jgi:hypothetical protein
VGDQCHRPVAPDIENADQAQHSHAQQTRWNLFKRACKKAKATNYQQGYTDIAAQNKMPLIQ